MKKKIMINLDGFITLDYVDNVSLFYRIISNFKIILDKVEIAPRDVDISNLLILYNKSYDKYIILGLEFDNQQNNLYDVFSKKFNINFNNFSKNLQIIYFLDNINDDDEKIIESDMYMYDVSIITNKYPVNKYLPITVMKQKFSIFLSNVLYFIKHNFHEIGKSDYIIISKHKYNSKLMNLDYIIGLKNYEIIGVKDRNGIKNKSHNLSVIKDLFKKNDTGIRDLDIDSFYKSYDYIIFNTKFIINIIDKIQEKNIIDLSIICSYYNQF
tara:strand:+ start:1608 stop:2414 length:807 start_codon:yes stop_codon:yes gene_type:complete